MASFLTSNLTVGFILGMLFNLPLALFGVSEWFVKDPAWAETIRRWSAVYQFDDFKRGVLSLGGMTYFVAIAAVMVYVSMILIGRRHWQSRDDGSFLPAALAIGRGFDVVSASLRAQGDIRLGHDKETGIAVFRAEPELAADKVIASLGRVLGVLDR